MPGEPGEVTLGITLIDGHDPGTFSNAWTSAHPSVQATTMDDLVEQSFGTMTDSLRSVVLGVAIIATGLTVLIAVLVVTVLTTTR